MKKRRTSSPPAGPLDEPRPSRAHATEYAELAHRLTRLRVAVDEGGRDDGTLSVTQRDHAALDHALADAVTRAFVADAAGAAPPEGVRSWVGEGLARSREREVALLAAGHVAGVLPTPTAAGHAGQPAADRGRAFASGARPPLPGR